MRVVVCTLFEKQYHLGVAVLVNSLTRAGFTGDVHTGFRGPLPPWAGAAVQRDDTTWEMPVAGGPRIIFIRIETAAHFTNFKPEFMLQVLDRSGADAVLYLDPDVVVNTTWRFLGEWLTCGIAVCDDVNSPMAENHPNRVGWRRFFQDKGYDLRYRGSRYANGGVIGVAREHRRLLEVWIDMMVKMSALLGGTDVAGIQDVLNAALEACPDIPVSFLGKQAMGFDAGTPLLPHATGNRKPWIRRFVREALEGRPPARVDKYFWKWADDPLQPFDAARVRSARRALALAAALGRFIRRT